MSTLRNLYVVLALSCVAGASTAQDTTQDRAAEGTAPERAPPPAQSEERAPANPAAEPSEPGTAADDRVTTTEEILADEEVTFPVDI